MLSRYYKKLIVLEWQESYFDKPGGFSFKRNFKGLIQPSTGSKTYNNGKDTTNVDALLFCSIKEKFEETDLIEYEGIRYKIAGAPVKPDGITGIKPKAGQHAEYNLIYTQEGL